MLSDEMNEEKPTFKVTDRRLFNPDGTPRDIEREAEATSAPAITTTTSASPETQTTAATTTGAVSSAKEAMPEPTAPAQAASEPSPIVSSQTSGAAQEAGDPTAFANLVMFIASPAAAAMGMTEHPGLAPGELDLPLAKHCIDLLATIQQKTRGNLGQQEQQILEGLLAELRMQFVSLTSTRPATTTPPRGFTGSDITGGR
jgi:hypothetical protein